MRVPLPTRGWRLWLAIALALVIAVRIAAPYAIEWAIEREATAALGVPVRVGDVDLWLFLGGVEVEDLRVGQRTVPIDVPEVEKRDALLAWSRVYAQIGWLDLPLGRIRIKNLEVDEPEVRVIRGEDGRIEPLPPTPSDPAAEPEATSAAAVPILLDRLVVRDVGVKLFSVDPERPGLLSFSLEEFSLADFMLDEAGAISLGGVGISGPKLRVKRDYVFEGAAAPATTVEGAEPAAPAASAAPPPYAVRRVQIERAEFTLEMQETSLDVALGFLAEDVTARPDTTFPVKLTLEVAQGTIEVDAKVGLNPVVFDGDVRWRNLHLPPLLAVAGPGPATWVRSGVAGGDVHAAFQPGVLLADPKPAVVSGTVSLADLVVHDPAEDVSVAWKSLDVAIGEARVPLRGEPIPAQIALTSVRLVDPAIAYSLPAPALDELTRAPAADGAAPEAEPAPPDVAAAPPAPEPHLSLGSFELSGGRLDFTDRTVQPFQEADVRALAISVKDVRYPERDARDLRIGAQIPGKGKLTVRGGMRGGHGEAQLTLDQMGLPVWNPYANGFGGVAIDSGSSTLRSKLKISPTRIEASNDLVIKKLGVSSRGESTVPGLGVPIDLALALLRDKNGDIALPIPVTVERGQAGVDVGAVVSGALKAALVGALQSPLKGLGMVAGAFGNGDGGLGVEPLRCRPGVAEIAADEEERLAGLGEMLASRPTLALALHGRSGPADGPGVAEQILFERLEAGDPPELAGLGFFQRRRLATAVRDRAHGRAQDLSPEDAEALGRWIGAVEIPPARLSSLASARAETLLARLVSEHGVPTTRVSIAPPAASGEPGVVIDLAAALAP